MIITVTDDHGTTYELSVDACLVREAEAVLATFTTPARALVMRNQYGPRDARLAGAVLQCQVDLASLNASLKAGAPPKDTIDAMEGQIIQLHTLLAEAAQIIEDHVAGFTERVVEFREAVESAAEDYPMEPAA